MATAVRNPEPDLDVALGESYYEGSRALEEQYINDIVEDTRRVISANFEAGRGPARRDAHAFDNGCVRAIFQVDENLPDELCRGVFVRGRQYKTWIRFSNGNSERRPGWMFDARGMAIKLTGVPGEKLMEDEKHTQDFVLINQPSEGSRPLVKAIATDQPFPSPAGQSVTINTISRIEYRADGGQWLALPPSDGAYNSSTESSNATLPLYDGQHSLEFRAINSIGATSPITHASVYVSGVGPAPAYAVDVPALANTSAITIALAAPAGSMVQISEDPFFGATNWIAAAPLIGWQFDQNDGEHTLYLRFRDTAAIDSPPFARALLLDRAAPTGRATLHEKPSPELEIQAHDAVSGVDAMQIISDGSAGAWQPYESSLPLTQAIATADHIQIRLRDTAGNVSQPLSVASPIYLPIVIR